MNFYENLKNYRLKNKLTQEDVATHLNLSRQTISKWEQGKSSPSIEDLIKLSHLYGVSLDELTQVEVTPSVKRTTKAPTGKWNLLLIAIILTFLILPIGGIIAIPILLFNHKSPKHTYSRLTNTLGILSMLLSFCYVLAFVLL